MINYSYIDYQTRVFFETRHILQQISLNLDTFGRNEGNFRGKNIIFQYVLNLSFVTGIQYILTHFPESSLLLCYINVKFIELLKDILSFVSEAYLSNL